MIIGKSPYINSINVTNSASDGISVITFKHQNIHLFSNWFVIIFLVIHFVVFIILILVFLGLKIILESV